MKRVRFSSRLHSSLFRSPLPLTSEVRKNRERTRRNKECPESRLPTSELGRSIDYIVSEGSARQGRPDQEGREGRVESETDEVRREGRCEKRDPRESRVSLQSGRSVGHFDLDTRIPFYPRTVPPRLL